MKYQFVLFVIMLSCSCKLNYKKHYIYSNKLVRFSFKFEDSGTYTKTNIVELFKYEEKGRFFKVGNKYYLNDNRIFDTLCVYNFELNVKLDSLYYLDLSNLAMSRNNEVSDKLTQDSLSYKLNGLPIEYYFAQNRNLRCKFNSPIVKLEISDINGLCLIDYIELRQNCTLRFSKLKEDYRIDDYFKLSLIGNKILVYDRFIGASLYFKEKFKKKKVVYRAN